MAYLGSLGVTVRVGVDPVGHREKLQQLSVKTNQFNLSLARLTEVDVGRWLTDSDRAVVGVWLADRLSDSGLIGALYLKRSDDTIEVEDLCISCRALGRNLEDAMVSAAINAAIGNRPVRTVLFKHATGSRNAPALEWLSGFPADCQRDD